MRISVAFRRWLDELFTVSPWTDVYAIGRSLVALSPLLTLLFNPTRVLFPPHTLDHASRCESFINKIGLACVTPTPEVARLIGIAILLAVVVGWLPRWFAIPHAWVAISLHNSMAVVEGGDQIAGNLALLLIPVALLDGRRWHWRALGGENRGFGNTEPARMISNTMLGLVRLQLCIVYLHAAIGKLGVAEWLDGTAVYYWLANPMFNLSGIRGTVAMAVVETSAGTMLLTWGTIVLEFALAFGLIASVPMRRGLFWAGMSFHLGIAAFLGLATFGVSMAGALVLYLWPRTEEPLLPGRFRTWARRLRAGTRTTSPADDAPTAVT